MDGSRWKAPWTLAPRWKAPGLKPNLTFHRGAFVRGLFTCYHHHAYQRITAHLSVKKAHNCTLSAENATVRIMARNYSWDSWLSVHWDSCRWNEHITCTADPILLSPSSHLPFVTFISVGESNGLMKCKSYYILHTSSDHQLQFLVN